jgi:hypothetical protein
LPGRGPGRGERRSPDRGGAGRGPPWPWPPWPPWPEPPWPGPGRVAAGRGPGTGPPRCGGAAGLAGAAPVGTGGTGARGTGPAGRGAPGRGPWPPADGPDAGVADGLAAGGAAACGLGPDGPAAGAGAGGRAGPGRGAGRPPLPSWPAGAGPGWPCDRLPGAFGPWAANSSLSLRTTGASIVEDAERTNSPISWSLAITALLSTPNSFASSYTRTFATALPLRPGSSGPSWPIRGSACSGRPQYRVLIAAFSSRAHHN